MSNSKGFQGSQVLADLGIRVGQMASGPSGALTYVEGVRVAHRGCGCERPQQQAARAMAVDCAALHRRIHLGDAPGSSALSTPFSLAFGPSERISVQALISHATRECIEPPVKAPLYDAARALQFVRSKAGKWISSGGQL